MTQQFTLEVVYDADPTPWMNREHPVTDDGKRCAIGDSSFGVALVPTDNPLVFGLRMDNGGDAAQKGGFFFNKIILRGPQYMSIAPRVNHAIGWASFQILIGNGIAGNCEYFPPRAIKTTRFVLVPLWKRVLTALSLGTYQPWRAIFAIRPKVTKHKHLALPKALQGQKAKYDSYGERILTSLRTGVPDPGVDMHMRLGMWAPMGDMDKGAVSGKGIEFFPGWELSTLYRMLSHDLTMERMPISHVDISGAPISMRRQEYFCTRGWNVSTQLSEYCVKAPWGGDDRLPKNLNSGVCEYMSKLVPVDQATFYTQRYLPYDDEHLCRATRHAKACAFLYGDPVAAHDLAMIAADANAGVHIFDHDQFIFGNHVAKYPDHGGCDRYGRAFAWSLNAIQCAEDLGYEWAKDAADQIEGELLRIQRTETASYQHNLPPPNEPKGWAPSPYYMPHPYVSLPHDVPCLHTFEVSYLATGLALAGYTRSAENAARFMSKTQPLQWMAAVPTGTPQAGDAESFGLWCLFGQLATVNPWWKTDVMPKMLAPGAPTTGPNVLERLLVAGNYEASAKAIESAESV